MSKRRMIGRFAAGACVVLSGCAVQTPHATQPLQAPAAWSVAAGGDVATAQQAWWTLLNDRAIDALVPAALADSPMIMQAIARVDEADANLRLSGAQRLPAVQADIGAARSRTMEGDGPHYATGASAGVGLRWEIDLFGRLRHLGDGARHRLDARGADAEAARLSLAARVADTVLALRGCRFSHAVLSDEIASRELTLALTRRKLEAGAAPAADEARARSGVAAARTALAVRQQACSVHMNNLVALTGRDADSVLALMAEPLAAKPSAALSRHTEWLMPAAPSYALGVPATVLARHPTVTAAQSELAAAWDDIGVARAERLPRLDLSAALTGQWLRAPGRGGGGWSLAPGLSFPLFDGGRGAANVSASEARYRAALAILQGAVRDAARDVENALAATASASTRLQTTRDAVDAAQYAFDATDAMWRAGATSLFVLEDARRQLAAAQNDAISAVQDSGQAWIALILACGNSAITSESNTDETF